MDLFDWFALSRMRHIAVHVALSAKDAEHVFDDASATAVRRRMAGWRLSNTLHSSGDAMRLRRAGMRCLRLLLYCR